MKFGYAQKNGADNDFDIQLQSLQDAACDEIVIDASLDSENLAKLLTLAKSGDCVAVWRLDKFAMSVDKLNRQVSALHQAGVSFISLQEQIFISPGDPGLLKLFEVMAEFERNTAPTRSHRQTGRKSVITPAKLAMAKELISGDEELSVAEAAKRIGVSRATLYRALKD